ncbi:MAG: 4-(cytidine 5'-diphospho)-2-C-methyl-D-erythritol kinase [Paracoccaceae bacterium]|nr:4-(cytidine 5'-diphospho)-2-C-methyl-D-erythritol kinase [Paracoccaceae bacterium]
MALQAQVFAPAKINLTLHVTRQRPDGYHLLDSLVVFADVGDQLTIGPSGACAMHVDGPEGDAVPEGADNLVLRAARLFGDLSSAEFRLMKNLPVASGVGGGSADAAAAYRGLAALCAHQKGTPKADLRDDSKLEALLALGADIPMCIDCSPARIRGIGENITPVSNVPPLHAVLVNPRRGVSTPSVFKALHCRDHPAMPDVIPTFSDARDMASWLTGQRNDLELAAMSLEPAIAQVKAALAACQGCLLARMSGSGATCFGLFSDHSSAQAAAAQLDMSHPNWWIKPTQLGDQSAQARPQLIRSTT